MVLQELLLLVAVSAVLLLCAKKNAGNGSEDEAENGSSRGSDAEQDLEQGEQDVVQVEQVQVTPRSPVKAKPLGRQRGKAPEPLARKTATHGEFLYDYKNLDGTIFAAVGTRVRLLDATDPGHIVVMLHGQRVPIPANYLELIKSDGQSAGSRGRRPASAGGGSSGKHGKSSRSSMGRRKIKHAPEKKLTSFIQTCATVIRGSGGLATPGLFREAANKPQYDELKKQIMAGADASVLKGSATVAAGVLKLFLRDMPEPLLTFELFESFLNASSHDFFAKQLETYARILDCLEDDRQHATKTLLDLLHDVAECKVMTAEALGVIFAPIILKGKMGFQNPMKCNRIVAQMIEGAPKLFPSI